MNAPDQDPLLPFLDLPPAPPAASRPAPEAGNPMPDAGKIYPLPAEAAENDTSDAASSERTNWKGELRRDFEAWLASLDAIPDTDAVLEAGDEEDNAPDLYAFYEQFAAASAESRKANRRTAEAMSQWGETLARFESGLQPLRDTTAQLLAAQSKSGELSRAHCLVLVELLDRMHRLARAFATPPVAKRSWWGGGDDTPWRQSWQAQHQALDILVSHLDGLLRKEGVVRIETAGQAFDPAVMMAVASEPDPTRPPQTVLEETAAGYRRRDELLRPAQVKVSH